MNTQLLVQYYPEKIKELYTSLRQVILDAVPGLKEEIDPMANMLVFNIKPGFGGMVFTLIPTEEHVTVGFFGGASLPDPHGLLTGKGAVHRQVKISLPEQIAAPEFTELILAAATAARDRLQEIE
jgi:hypothetical protein